MKRILSLFLLLTLLISLVSCQTQLTPKTTQTGEVDTKTQAQTQTKEETPSQTQGSTATPPANFPTIKPLPTPDHSAYISVPEPMTMDRINEFPIATDAMPIQERRALCVDFFRLAGLVQYTPTTDFTYKQTAGTNGKYATVKKGTIYSGLPYVTSGKGNIYTLMYYYDEKTGVLDTSVVTDQEMGVLIGNQCSYGSFWAWSRVVNSTKHNLTNTMHSNNGCIPIGPYTYNCTGDWAKSNLTKTVCQTNGEQVMYQSYANYKLADGMVMYGAGGGHVQMISQLPVVIKNVDGTIDGDKSYIRYLDQGSSFTNYSLGGGVTSKLQADIDVKMTFKQMYSKGYLPFTFAEFLGTDPVEDATIEMSQKDSKIQPNALFAGYVKSNYAISDVTLTIVDPEGNILLQHHHLPSRFASKVMQLNEMLLTSNYYDHAKAGNFVQLDCRVGNGVRRTIYQGEFI